MAACWTTCSAGRWRFYTEFLNDWRHFFHLDAIRLPTGHEPTHTFACFRQIQRAFEQLFRDIIGGSLPAARLRASIWQSIFTHDMRRYRRSDAFLSDITGALGSAFRTAAAEQALAKIGGIVFSQPHPLECEVAEIIRDVVPCAQQVRFLKTEEFAQMEKGAAHRVPRLVPGQGRARQGRAGGEEARRRRPHRAARRRVVSATCPGV